MKYDIVLKLLLMTIVIFLYYAGLTAVNLHYRDGAVRQSMGFSNPNTFSSYIMSIILEFLFLRRKKIGIREIIVTLISIFIIDYFADSRTQIICVASVLILLLINQWKNGKIFYSKISQIIISNIFIIMLIISTALVQSYITSPSSTQMINDFFSGRLQNSATISKEYNLSIIGNSEIVEQTVRKEGFAFDNSYIYIPYVYGIVPTIFIAISINRYMKYMFKNKNREILLIMLILLISGIMEKVFMRIQFDFFLLYFSYIIYGNFSEQQSEKLSEHNKVKRISNVTH